MELWLKICEKYISFGEVKFWVLKLITIFNNLSIRFNVRWSRICYKSPLKSFDTSYLSVFSSNAGKYEQEKLWIRTILTQWYIWGLMSLNDENFLAIHDPHHEKVKSEKTFGPNIFLFSINFHNFYILDATYLQFFWLLDLLIRGSYYHYPCICMFLRTTKSQHFKIIFAVFIKYKLKQ